MPARLPKITRPRLAQCLPRNRLFDSLDQARHRPVVWISGPPGSGKTSLVTSYLEARQLAGIWFQIDIRDADTATFFYYLRLASGKAAPRRRNDLPLLTPEYAHGLSAFTHTFFEGLYARHKAPFAIVFDNYQEVPDNAMLHNVMRDALAMIPEGINVILISRTEPPPALARVQVDRALARLAWDELRFTESESLGITEMLSQDKHLSHEAIKAFHEQAQGWVAGLVLLIEHSSQHASQHPPLSVPPDTAIPEVVFGYFAKESLQGTEDETRELLLKTAFLPDVTDEAARTLTGDPDAPQILSALARRNFFTQRLAKSERSYRYHPLFRDFLQDYARGVFDAGQLAALQRQTAGLLVAAGQVEDAAELLHASADWQGLIDLILEHAPALLGEARFQVLGTWLGYVPPPLQATQPWLLYWQGVCRLFTAADEAYGYFEQAFSLFEGGPDPVGRLLCWSGAVDAILLMWSDFTLMDRWITWADEHIPADGVLPGCDIEARVATSMVGALFYRAADHPAIDQWVERVLKAAEKTNDINLRLRGYTFVALFFGFMGDLPRCNAIAERLQVLAGRHRTLPVVLLIWKWIEASSKWTFGEGRAAIACVEEGLALAAESGVHMWDHMLLAQGVHGALNAGDLDLAGRYIERKSTILDREKTHMVAHHEYLQGWYRLLCGETQDACAHAQSAVEMIVRCGALTHETICRLAWVHTLVADGALAEAENELAVAGERVARLNRPFFTFMYHIACANVALQQQRNKDVLGALKTAMALGRQHDYMSLFGWNPGLMARLCARALAHNIEIDYVTRLIRKRQLTGDEQAMELDNWPWPVKIYTLGRFAVEKDGRPVPFRGKSPTKQLELLKALIVLGGQEVKETQLSDTLWPDADMAYQNFTATLHRLRKLIGHDAIELSNRRVTLNPKYCWVDCFVLEHMLGRINTLDQGDDGSSLRHKVVQLYQGPFLAGEDAFWVLAKREHLDKKFRSVLDAFDDSIDENIRAEAVFSAGELK